MPLNRQMVACVIDHADLLVESDLPQCVRDLLAHVAAYEGILSKRDTGNESHHTPALRFPYEIREYAAKHYVWLKSVQAGLHENRDAKESALHLGDDGTGAHHN